MVRHERDVVGKDSGVRLCALCLVSCLLNHGDGWTVSCSVCLAADRYLDLVQGFLSEVPRFVVHPTRVDG